MDGTHRLMINGPTSNFFISQRLKLHYVEWGNPDAPPLLLIHGGRDHCRSWDWTARALGNDWRIIAPDLRGHGESAWSPEGNYTPFAYIFDLAQLIHGLNLAPLTILSHSFGGNLALRYTGLYPDQVKKLIAIEGIGPAPEILKKRESFSFQERWQNLVEEKRSFASKSHRRYKSIDDALKRMKAVNGYLTDEQARHLTIHGTIRNEDGTYSWKFDPYLRIGFGDMGSPLNLTPEQDKALWGAITCPVLHIYGDDSWASNPVKDGRASFFKTAKVVSLPNAGHWVQHDQFDAFMDEVNAFFA